MLTVRFSKISNMRFIPHVDFLRTITRTILRADIDINYSEGFNPHALIFLTSPMPLGIGSKAEYMMIETKGEVNDFVSRFNRVAPVGLIAEKAFFTKVNPKLTAKIVEADYSFFANAYEKAEEIIKIKDDFTLTVTKNGETKVSQVAEKIKKVEVFEDRIKLRLDAGNSPLRADRLAENLNLQFGLNIKIPDIIKEEQYVFEKKLINADEYLETLL